jgi:hypothetical protein
MVSFSTDRFQKRVNGLKRTASHIAVAQVGTLGVVADQPLVEVRLEGVDSVVEGRTQGLDEEFFRHGALEALDEVVGLRRARAGATAPTTATASRWMWEKKVRVDADDA